MSICTEMALMGIPTVTMTGEGMQSRGASRINKAIGVGFLNADSEDKFIKIAYDLSQDLPKLDYLRKNLYGFTVCSPVISGAKEFTEDLENKYIKAYNDFINSP